MEALFFKKWGKCGRGNFSLHSITCRSPEDDGEPTFAMASFYVYPHTLMISYSQLRKAADLWNVNLRFAKKALCGCVTCMAVVK
jgi:hypothetical protein